MTPPDLQDSQSTASSFESLFISFDGVQGPDYPQDLLRDELKLMIAAGQSWEAAVAELREELDLPAESFRLTLHRLRGGQRWRIAKSAWAGIKPDEEIHLVALPIQSLSQDDKKPKDEPKPKSASSPRKSTPTPGQPISPRSLSNSAAGRRSPSADHLKGPPEEVVVPATPSDSTVSDTEDEAMPLEEEEALNVRAVSTRPTDGTTVCGREEDRYKGVNGSEKGQTPLGFSRSGSLSRSPSPSRLDPDFAPLPSNIGLPLPSASQASTTTTEHERRHARRSYSPSPSCHSERSPATKARLLLRGTRSPPPPDIPPSSSPPDIKSPPSSFPASLPIRERSATPPGSFSAAFPPPAQHIPPVAGPSNQVSSQPSDESEASFRIGIDSSGQVNFVPASSPRATYQGLAQGPLELLADESAHTEEEEQQPRLDKGKGKAIEGATNSNEEEEETVVPRSSPARVKREPRSSPKQSEASTPKRSPSSSRRRHLGIVLEIINSNKRQDRGYRIESPTKRRRISDESSTRSESTTSSGLLKHSSNSPKSRLPAGLHSPVTTRPPAASLRTSSASTQQPEQPSTSGTAITTQRKARASLSSRKRKLVDETAALARPRVEIPSYPRSGRFCLWLRLPNAPIAPKWANAGLRAVHLVKYQGNGSATLGNTLSHVFRCLSVETGWPVRDLRLRYTDTSAEDEEEREKSAWGFDTILTDFQNLEEWGVREQDYMDVDFVPFSSSRIWSSTE